jgi:copper resistance protein C
MPLIPVCRLTLLLLALVLAPAPVAAHAIIVASSPEVDAVVRGSKVAVMLRFNGRIDHERSRLTLVHPDASAEVVPLVRSAGPDGMAANVRGLAPGAYRLRWQVLGIDGHITRGDIPFTVAP